MNTLDHKQTIVLERRDSMQIETVIQTGQVAKFKIVWKNPCQYYIYQISTSKPTTAYLDSFFEVNPAQITITSGTKDYYIFSASRDIAGKHATYYIDTIKIYK